MERYDGVYLSFDLIIDSLKIYYDYDHPKNAYYALNKFLTSRGFEPLRDSDYIHDNLDVSQTAVVKD